MRKIEILDTTLRDGEQTAGVSFSMQEKISLAHLLLTDLNVDRLEIASAKVSETEFNTAKRIAKLANRAGKLDRVEVLGFIDNGNSAQWIHKTGCKTINILAKGSHKHLTEQLKKTTDEHSSDIVREVNKATDLGLKVNIYLEDWSNGIANSAYVYQLVDKLQGLNINRFILCDTLGILNPHTTWRYCRNMLSRYPDLDFDFHAHNDYDLAVANSIIAAELGLKALHVTMNGLGERAGNTPLSSIVAVLHDQFNIRTNITEQNINKVSRIVESYSGHMISFNQPIIGSNVFTQCAGIHADGDNKSQLYYNALYPERFGRTREYALGKLSGKSNISKNLEALGIELNREDMERVVRKVTELGGKKELITPEDLPYIISDVLKHGYKNERIKISSFAFSLSSNARASCTVIVSIDNKEYSQTALGDGQFHAFSKALWKIYTDLRKPIPELINYELIIPPGGQTNALAHSVITWKFNEKIFKTRALNADQIRSAVMATEKMLNLIEDI